MAHKAPGKAYREGLTLVDMMSMFPTEEAATKWFEAVLWDGQRCCRKCGSTNTREVPNAKPMPYWCPSCRGYFSVRTGTPIARSKIPMRKWAIAIYLCLTSLKSVSSMKLHRDIGVSQPAAWFMLHRIREAWAGGGSGGGFSGPVEADETYFGGKRRNMSNAQRRELAEQNAGRGTVGKTAVVGVKDRATKQVRAKVVTSTDKPTLQGFVIEHTAPRATVYTDEASAYEGLPFKHERRQAQRRRVRPGHGAHERRGVVLVDAQARPHGHVPQAQPEAPGPVRSGVRRQAEPPRVRNARTDARHRREAGRAEPSLPGPRRRQRAFERGAVVEGRGPRSRASRPQGRVGGQVRVSCRTPLRSGNLRGVQRHTGRHA